MTNAAAIGYMILAAKKMGMDEEKIKELATRMYYRMDEHTEEEAEEAYRKS
jgi:predicted solute-binding protein